MDLVNGLLGKAPPLPGYRFAVVLFTGLVPQIAPVDLRFQKVSGLAVERSFESNQHQIRPSEKTARRTLTLSRGLPSGPTPLQLVQLGEQAFWTSRLLRTEILVATLSDHPIPIPTHAWLITGAYLQGISWEGIDGGANGLAIESMKYSYSNLVSIPIGNAAAGAVASLLPG